METRTKAEIKDVIKKIEADERLSYEPAKVEVNAPLALVQVNLQAKVDTLKWVLKEIENIY